MVKDLRTDYETSHTERVLDGEIDELILAYLKKNYKAALFSEKNHYGEVQKNHSSHGESHGQ